MNLFMGTYNFVEHSHFYCKTTDSNWALRTSNTALMDYLSHSGKGVLLQHLSILHLVKGSLLLLQENKIKLIVHKNSSFWFAMSPYIWPFFLLQSWNCSSFCLSPNFKNLLYVILSYYSKILLLHLSLFNLDHWFCSLLHT